MAKALPIVGIVGAVFGALVVAVLANAALFLPLLVGLAGSIVLLGQRTVAGTVAGLAVLVLTVLAGLGMGSLVSTEDGSFDAGVSEFAGLVLMLAACLAVPVAAALLRRDELDQAWLPWAAAACAAIAVLLAATDSEELGNHGTLRTLAMALLALATAVPSVLLLRSGGDEHAVAASSPPADAPLAAAEGSVRAQRGQAAPKQAGRSPGRRP